MDKLIKATLGQKSLSIINQARTFIILPSQKVEATLIIKGCVTYESRFSSLQFIDLSIQKCSKNPIENPAQKHPQPAILWICDVMSIKWLMNCDTIYYFQRGWNGLSNRFPYQLGLQVSVVWCDTSNQLHSTPCVILGSAATLETGWSTLDTTVLLSRHLQPSGGSFGSRW